MAYALFFLLPAVPVAVLGLLGYGLGRGGAWRTGPARLRSLAALLAAAAACCYGLGLLGLATAVLDSDDSGTDSAPLRPCRVPGEPHRAEHVVGYTVRYLPLGFICETTDGDGYPAPGLPRALSTSSAGLALASAALAGTAAVRSRPPRTGAGPVPASPGPAREGR
jgi:hypothetical protein